MPSETKVVDEKKGWSTMCRAGNVDTCKALSYKCANPVHGKAETAEERAERIRREVREANKTSAAIDLVDVARKVDEQIDRANDKVRAVIGEPTPARRKPGRPPKQKEQPVPTTPKTDITIAGGKRAPIIDVEISDPPAPPPKPAKPKPLDPLTALVHADVLEVVRQAEGDWVRVLVWPSKTAAKRWEKAAVEREDFSDFEAKAGRIGDESSGLWLRTKPEVE